jgi:hypothetical protein
MAAPVDLTYRDERGTVQSVRSESKPLVAVYSEETPYSEFEIPAVSGTEIVQERAKDVWASVSFDEGRNLETVQFVSLFRPIFL